MWKCDRFQQTLRELSNHKMVGEIICIDNTKNELTIELPKLVHILEGKNIFFNPYFKKNSTNKAIKIILNYLKSKKKFD